VYLSVLPDNHPSRPSLRTHYVRADPNLSQRAMVLLHILSQPVPVKIDAASLRKAG